MLFKFLTFLLIISYSYTLIADENRLIIASTTSTTDTGLLNYLNTEFNKIYDIKIHVLALGTGQAIKIAEGEYYAFLDSDDLWYPNKLDNQITFMINNKIAFSYTGYNFISESGEFKNLFIQAKNKIKYSDLLKTNHIGCLTVIYNAKKVNKNEKIYMSNMR